MRSALLLSLCVGAFAAPSPKIIQTAPIQFEQTGSQWTARGLGYAFRFEKTGTAMRLGDSTLRVTFENANASAPFTGLVHSAHPTNSFRGQSYQRIENFARLRRTGIYPGIDLLYYSRNGELEYDFEVAPDADPSRIAMNIEGADSIRLNDHGDLVITLSAAPANTEEHEWDYLVGLTVEDAAAEKPVVAGFRPRLPNFPAACF